MAQESVVRARMIGFFTAVAIAALPIVLGSTANSNEEGRGSGSAAEGSIAAATKGMAEPCSFKRAGREQNMAGNFFEVLLKWAPSGPDPHVREWLERLMPLLPV